MHENRRFAHRNTTEGVVSSLYDGTANHIGVVEDVSLSGICISNIPASFNCSSNQCFSLINAPLGEYKVVLKPRWAKTTNNGMYKTIGFKIHNPPPGWTQFVRKTSWGSVDRELLYA